MQNDYRERPVQWVRDVLGGDPWAKQEEILRALATHSRVTVRSCHGIGKSWTAACAVLWFLYTRTPSLVLTTAPTHRQVREVLWKEIRRQHRRMGERNPGSDLWPRGELRETALRLGDDRFALGLTTDETDRFQGFHSPHVLVVVDEASGVSEEIFQAIEGVLTTEEARLLLIGNPLHARGAFYESHRKGPWARFAISAFDSPNLQGLSLADPGFAEAKPRRSGLVTPRWVLERFQEWGEESPLYQSRVLGQFPDQSSDALIRLSWIEAAVRRGKEPRPDSDAWVEFGADIARFGDCETVVCVRRGPDVLAIHAWRKTDLMETVRRIEELAARLKPSLVKVDAAGLGAGVVDRLRESSRVRVVEINVGAGARNQERFGLLRDELFFGLRDRFRDGDITLPEDRILTDQLAALSYEVNDRGQQAVTSKSELRRRNPPSPDRADALALAFAPVIIRRPVALVGRPR